MTESLSGTVERVTFHNEENGFCVLRIKIRGRRDLTTVVGHLPSVSPGEYLDATGSWVVDREHGRQFKSDTLRVAPPSTLEGIRKYLASGMIKGIGPRFAERLVDAFGEKVFDVIENEPRRLRRVQGIGAGRQQRILDAWSDQKVIRHIMVFLQSHGVGTARAVRIYKTYGRNAVDKVRENPYRLAHDISGIGFKISDALAEKLGVDRESPMRAQAGLAFVLQTLGEQGHCAYPAERLVQDAAKMLEIPSPVVEDALASEIETGRLVKDALRDEPCVYLASLHQAEIDVANGLHALRSGGHPLPSLDAEGTILWVQGEVELALAAGQKDALRTAFTHKIMVITGGPGVGKTTLLNSLLRIYRSKSLRCLLCAPTGRASRRLEELTGLEAKTVHRLLEVEPGSGRFKRNARNPLDGDVVVLDEASMVDVSLMAHLVRALPSKAAFVIVGDADQLPSVGPGNVLRALMEAGAVPVARLSEVFRQASKSRIVTTAHLINNGNIPPREPGEGQHEDLFIVESEEPEDILDKILRMVKERIPRRFNLDPVRDVQVLTPMNRSFLGARELNERLQKELNPGPAEVQRFGASYRTRDKVMQIRNNYDKDVFNGDVGYIVRVDPVEREVTVDFEGREAVYDFGELDEVVPAYACTIHKSQGSEYPAVIIPLHTQHYMMLHRNLLYTGVTRGRKLVVLVGSRKALGIAVRRAEQGERISGLAQRLRKA